MTDRFQNRYRIPSARAAWRDYANNGAYFITIKTAGGEHCFGRVVARKMNLSDIGTVAHKCWMDIPTHFPFVELGAFVVMPNHVHGIIIIDNPENPNTAKPDDEQIIGNDNEHTVRLDSVETQNFASLPPEPPTYGPQSPHSKTINKFGPQSKNLASIIRGYKTGVKKYATMNGIPFQWQPLYHDHIIRDDGEYVRISDYIASNPAKWEQDRHYRK